MKTAPSLAALVFDGERAAFLESPPAEDGSPQDPALVDSRYLGTSNSTSPSPSQRSLTTRRSIWVAKWWTEPSLISSQ